MTRTRTRWATIAAAALLLVTTSACGGPGSRTYHADPPSSLPTIQGTDPCVVRSPIASTAGSGSGTVTVDADPVGAVLVWTPGFNDSPCRATQTQLDGRSAQLLASDVRDAPEPSDDTRSCPSADSAAVTAYFLYAGAATQAVRVTPGGCGDISAPDRGSRSFTPALRSDLAAVAPPAWVGHVQG